MDGVNRTVIPRVKVPGHPRHENVTSIVANKGKAYYSHSIGGSPPKRISETTYRKEPGYILRATFSIRFSRQGVDSSILNDPLQLKRYIGTIPFGSFCAHSAGRFDTFIRRCIRSIFAVSRGTLVEQKGCAPLPPIRKENSKGQPLSSFSPGCPEENVG